MKLVYLGLVPLLSFAQEAAENTEYYEDYDPANYEGEDYDMNANQETYVAEGDAADYTAYGPDPIDDFDPSGTDDDLIDNPDDLHLLGEVHFEDDNTGLMSQLGAEESDEGFRSADPEQQMVSVQKYQDLLFRRIKTTRRNKKEKFNNKKDAVHKPKWNKKKKNKKGQMVEPAPIFTVDRSKFSMKYGAISAFENALVVDRGGARGCDRGWAANHKICANSCRVAWLEGNPRKTFKSNAAAFYKTNFVHTKCEACVMWSGLVKPKSPSFYQKSISNLKKGAPLYSAFVE